MPTDVLPILKDILNHKKCIHPVDSSIKITEAGRQARLKSINIVSLGTQALALKFDQCGFPGDKTFVAQHGMHSACDALIFCQFKGDGYILCCELKSSQPTRHEATEQLRSAHCFLNYLDSLFQQYHGLSIHNWKRRYFLFHNTARTPLDKPPLIEQSPTNHSPDYVAFVPVHSGQSIYLRKLLGIPS